MAGVRIVTDSACDLTAEQAAEWGVSIVPLTIRFGSEELTDLVELSVADFYRRMAESSDLPETAAPSPGAFETVFRGLVDDGATGIVCINLSGELSATIESARNAARAVEGVVEVRVIDSRTLTAGLGTIVLEAARAARGGASIDEIESAVQALIPRTRVYATLDTLDNLKKGGRIGAAKHLLGSMLSFKPVINVSEGKVEEAGRARTRKKALLWLRDKLYEEPTVDHLAVCDGEAADVDEFLDLIADRYPRESIRTGRIGAVIGTHGGPRVIGICYLAKP
ncbi:MAG TPA: DegV family protein [Acidimicrobiales bacterium]|nr:DegV family protein [Acidimicrobiales bacterium]